MFAPDFGGLGPEGLNRLIGLLGAAFPGVHIADEEQIAEGDRVAIRWTIRGTHRGEWLGAAPTGEWVRFGGVSIWSFEGGKVVRDWQYDDQLQALGLTPPPAWGALMVTA